MDTPKTTPAQEKWRELIRQWESSQMSAKAWCLQREVSYVSFISWRSRLRNTPQSTSNSAKVAFVELVNAPPAQSGIEIHVQNHCLHVSTSFDSATLLRCLQVLEKL